MKWIPSIIAVIGLVLAPFAAAQSLPPVVERYEQLLVRSPGKGTAFDKVYQHFFEGEGLEKLAARWTAKAEAPGADAATYWLLLGVLADRQGKAPEAIRLYQRAAGMKPDARTWSALGDAQAAAGNLPEAIKALQKALAANPTADVRPQLFRQLARSQQRAFDGEGALKTWQQFIAESPDDPFAIEEAADAMAEVERFAEAKAQYEKLRDLAGTDPYRRVTAIIKLAQLEEKQGRREQARALYESALPLASPTSWMHREVRARIEESYRRQDDLPGLVTYYEAWLKKQAKDVDVALRLSDALIELNRKADAVTWLRQASEWAPDRKEVQVALAKRLGEIDQPREAVTILTKLTQAHPEEESFREFLGDAHWQVFKTAKDEAAKQAAIESWRQLAPPTTKDANKVSRVADLFRARELAAEALEHYARAVALAPDVPELRQRWAEYLFELKREEEGMAVLREMVAGERATAPNFLRLARLLQRRHDLAGAQDSVEKGLAKEPANFELLTVQWRLFSETEKWEQAAGLFERLLAAAPSVYSVDQVEDQQVQALRGLGRLDEVSRQLAGRIGKEPALMEAELRLLLRIALQSGDLETAGEGLADAKQRFPESASLVRRQVEYEKRKGNLEGRVAALQRLVELQPKQKIEWLREIVRAYQDEGLWDKALAAAQHVIEEAPASPDSHVLASDLNFAAQRFEAGVAKLRDAIKLSDKPNDLRLRLARAFLDAGRNEEARQTFDAVFEAENDPKMRLALTRQLAEVYLQQGKLDELIGRFRQRQRAEEGGWRYALYLAEIFQQMQDFAAAREELSKALGARSRDGNFLRQLMRLSEAEGNTMESARFARLLAEAEPSEAHQIDLAEALLDNGDAEEALKVLRANEDAFLKNPIAWREALLKFHGAGAGAALAEALRGSLERRADNWRGRLTLAEMQLGLGDWAGAERWLWEILAMPSEAAAPAAPSTPAVVPAYPGGYYAGGSYYPGARSGSMSKYLQRVGRIYQVRQNLAQIFAGQSRGMGRSRYNYGRGYQFGGAVTQPSLGSLEEARDAAIVYLATLAQQQDRGEAFLGELQKRMAGAPRAERLVAYGLVQARELLQREVEIEAAQPSGDAEIDDFCLRMLIGMVQQEGRQKGVASRELALIETFFQRERRPEELVTGKMSLYQVLTQAGRTEEANKLADAVLAKAETADTSVLPSIFGFAILREAFDVAEKTLARLLAASQQPGNSAMKQQISWYQFSLASGLLQKKESSGRGVQMLAGMLKESYPARLPTSLAALSPYARRSYRAAWREGQQFPYPNRYFDDARIQMWRQIFDRLKAAEALGEMKEELNRHIQSLPDDQTVFTQLARACFWWWDGERGDAIREVNQLARELKDDDLRMMVSAMLAEAGQPAEALKALELVTATSGDLAIDKLVRMLVLARAANDLDRAKEIALALAGQRLDANDEPQVINALSELGLKEKVEELNKRRAVARAPGSRNRIEDQLQQQVSAKNEKEAVALARAILARDPITTMRQGNEDYARQRAVEALRTFKMLDAYRVELEKQLTEAPSSVRTVYLLAEAHGQEDSAKALGYYRKLVELKPADTAFQLKLAGLLVSNKQPEEAMRIWEALLARDPEPVMQDAFYQLVDVYKNSKQMARLGAALTRLPKRPASLANMAMYGGGQDYGQYFNQVAAVLQREGKTEEAIQVWRVALAESEERRSGNQWTVLAPLASALIEVGDSAGAATAIERFFFPEVKPKPLFGFESSRPTAGWLQISTITNGRFDYPSAGLLRLARQAGALDRLRAKAVASAEGGNETDGQLVLLIDAQRRDAATLEDLATRARTAMQRAVERRDLVSLGVLHCLAQELREWPEGRRLALELMIGVCKGRDRLQNDGFRVLIGPQAAELAVELGENETARSVLREWVADVQKQGGAARYGFDYRQQIPVMDLMARVGLADEVRALLKTMKASSQWKNDTSAWQKLEEFENRLALLGGEPGRARITVWAVPPSAKEAPSAIYWEIGPAIKARRNDSRSRGLSVSGEELPALDGRYELELFHGPTPSAMRKLATLPAAKARGSWTSPAPLAAGYVLAVAREKSSVLFSSAAYVATGPNLLTNPQFRPDPEARPKQPGANRPTVPGWPGLGADAFVVRRGGPRPGGEYVSVQSLQRSGRETITAQRIPIEPGKEYLFAGWLRYPSNSGSARFMGRFYDKDGKPLDQVYMDAGDGDRWAHAQRWLVRSRGAGGNEQAIPEKAVELELMIEASSGCDVDGLYFGEVIRGSAAPARENE
jgi:tetratricopeptide (TPR) repeat protein